MHSNALDSVNIRLGYFKRSRLTGISPRQLRCRSVAVPKTPV